MFTQDLGATKTYRTLARGFGSRWGRTYQVLQQDHAAHHNPQRPDLGSSRRLSSTHGTTGKRVE
jgi:hypothetical protein